MTWPLNTLPPIFKLQPATLVSCLNRERTFAPQRHHFSHDYSNKLCQLRTITCLLMASTTTTLVQAFITAQLDCCLKIYSGLSASWLSCHDHKLQAVARLISQIPKYQHVTRYKLDALHKITVCISFL